MKTLLLILSLTPQLAFAWGSVGHRTTALVAEAKLSQEAKSQISVLLGGETLSAVANWADSLKSRDGYQQTTWYHFEKIPDGLTFLQNLAALPEWQQKKGGIVGAILMANRILREKSASREEQADALKFLVHFLGDIHQPLHSGRPEDKGGVTIAVNWMGKATSLHAVWDSAMISTGHAAFFREGSELGSQAYAAFLLRQHQDDEISLAMNVEGWLNESLALRTPAYDTAYSSDQARYQATHLPTVDRRIYVGGARLAALLNDIFSGYATPQPEQALWAAMEHIVGPLQNSISFKKDGFPSARPSNAYPAEWWAPVPREGAPAWEILPQDAGPGEVILSKRNELGILSNFAPTPFTLDGEHFASVEGFWQMMKYPEGTGDERLRDPSISWPFTRAQVAAMSAFEAKEAGTKANELMKKLKIDWVTFQGKKMSYLENTRGDFYRLIFRAEKAKLEQNAAVEKILRKTGTLKLLPDHRQHPGDPPAWRYFEIWMELRSSL